MPKGQADGQDRYQISCSAFKKPGENLPVVLAGYQGLSMTQSLPWLSPLILEIHVQAAVWRSWDGLSAAVAPLHGTLLPAPWAAHVLSGYLEAGAASQTAGWLYLERRSLLGPGMGVSGPWEDGFFSESCLFWPVLLLAF